MIPNKIRVRRRFFRIFRLFFLMALDLYKEFRLTRKRGFAFSQKKMEALHEKRARQLYNLAVSYGGVLIKLCQYLSTRRDVLPESYIRILSSLQDAVPPIPFSAIEPVLLEEYGDYNNIFSEIHREPVASASLGQVHNAVLPDGKEVTLKILKPGVERIIDIDFAILHFVAKMFSHLKTVEKAMDLQELMDEFIRVTGDELNFKREAYIASLFKQETEKLKNVSVPAVSRDLSTRKVLVMEYVRGDKISEPEKWTERNNDPGVIVDRLIGLYFEQFIGFSVIHFDPHPGNILVSENNKIILLDFGMAGFMTEELRADIRKLLKAFIKKDSRGVLDILDRLGFIRKGVNRYSLLPLMDYFLNDLIDALKLDRESLQTMDFSPIGEELAKAIYLNPITIPVHWAYMLKTLGTLIGVIVQLKPDFNIYDDLKPYVEKLLEDWRLEALREAPAFIKNQLSMFTVFPERTLTFFDGMERGRIKVAVDYTEINEQLEGFKKFVLRTVLSGLSILFAATAYIFYTLNRMDIVHVLSALACFLLLVILIYRGKSRRERIKQFFD